MKRRMKLFLIAAAFACLVGIGVVLRKIQQNAAQPFPGAVVVLEDASWQARDRFFDFDTAYHWNNAKTIVYTQREANGTRVVRRALTPQGIVSSPDVLPIVLTKSQSLLSLSPNGKTLCIMELNGISTERTFLLNAHGQGKPILLPKDADCLVWSPDSTALYGFENEFPPHSLQRYDARTGAAKKVSGLITSPNFLPAISPEGKLFAIEYDVKLQQNVFYNKWRMVELRNGSVVTITSQKGYKDDFSIPNLSPDGKRLLWHIVEAKSSTRNKGQRELRQESNTLPAVTRYFITDIDGKNERTLGVIHNEQTKLGELLPQWTPDSRGVHFIQNGKLMYLRLP